jgi:cell division protein ZapA
VKTVQVRIFDQSYTLQGELDEDYVGRLARSVDQKMRAIAEATGTLDIPKVAVLVALNFADELETFRKERGEVHRKIERCIRLVETALRRSE